MITSVDDWMLYLKCADTLVGLPLLVGGATFMLFGWRIWRACVVMSFGLMGAGLAAEVVGSTDDQWWYALGGALILGTVAYYLGRFGVALLGGIIGAGTVMHFLGAGGAGQMVLWSGGGVGLIGAGAYAFINRRLMIIVVTSFLGAVMVVSGLLAFVSLLPVLSGTLLQMSRGSAIVLPFVVMVPTVMSCFFQVGEVRRLQIEL